MEQGNVGLPIREYAVRSRHDGDNRDSSAAFYGNPSLSGINNIGGTHHHYAGTGQSDTYRAHPPIATEPITTVSNLLTPRPAGTLQRGHSPSETAEDIQLVTGNKYWLMSRKSNTLFTGRQSTLQVLHQSLVPTQRPRDQSIQRVFVLVGLGGAGKSEVAIKFAEETRESFWGVFWVDASSHQSAEASFVNIAETLNLSGRDLRTVLQWLANTNRRWLLILDNCDDSQIDYSAYFPPTQRGSVLMTTRVLDCAVRHKSVGYDVLESMPSDTAVELLLKACEIPQLGWKSKENDAKQVTDRLGQHALTIVQAGAYINHGLCKLEEYPATLEARRQELLTYKPTQAQSDYGDVYATFEVSVKALESSPEALMLLKVLAFMHREDVQEDIFTRAWEHIQEAHIVLRKEDDDIARLSAWHVSRALSSGLVAQSPKSFRRGRARLAQLSIVTLKNDPDSISMHPLIHGWAMDRMDRAEQEKIWEIAGSILALSTTEIRGWRAFSRNLQPHLETWSKLWLSKGFAAVPMHGSKERSNAGKFRGLRNRSNVFRSDSQPKTPATTSVSCSDVTRMGFAIAWQLNSLGSPDTLPLAEMVQQQLSMGLAVSTYNVVLANYLLAINLLQKVETAARAETLLEEITRVQRHRLKPQDPEHLKYQHALAATYLMIEQYEKAIGLLEKVVEIYETTLDPKDPKRLTSLQNLAWAYAGMKQYEDAIGLLEK
ncbi:hypothetical protein B0A49_13267, partial [Cryomyces minteri]